MERVRKCQNCGIVKPISEFRATLKIHSGYYWDCRECQDEKREAYEKAVSHESKPLL